MFIKQLLVGPFDVFGYLVGCNSTKIAIIIDPGADPDLIVKEAEATPRRNSCLARARLWPHPKLHHWLGEKE